ncbi:MAG: hypothetical protein ABNH21_16855 [Glaciecola sp.]
MFSIDRESFDPQDFKKKLLDDITSMANVSKVTRPFQLIFNDIFAAYADVQKSDDCDLLKIDKFALLAITTTKKCICSDTTAIVLSSIQREE